MLCFSFVSLLGFWCTMMANRGGSFSQANIAAGEGEMKWRLSR